MNAPQLENTIEWGAVLEQLELGLAASVFETWLSQSRLFRMDGDTLIITVRSTKAADIINKRLKPKMEKVLKDMYERPLGIKAYFSDDPFLLAGTNGNGRNGEHGDSGRIRANGSVVGAGEVATLPEPEPPAAEEEPENYEKMLPLPGDVKRSRGRPRSDAGATERVFAELDDEKEREKKLAALRPTNSFYIVQRYASRFYRPLLGTITWCFWEVLSDHENLIDYGIISRDQYPDISVLTELTGLKRSSRHRITGREATASRPATKGALEELAEWGIIKYWTEGPPRQRNYIIKRVVSIQEAPLLTPKQVLKLSPDMQRMHQEFLSYYTKSKVFSIEDWWATTAESHLLDGMLLDKWA